MKILKQVGSPDIAMVYLADLGDGRLIEFVESVQPPRPREEKWVQIISTLLGCPVGCSICDAGYYYQGKLSEKELLDQIDFLVKRRYPDGRIPAQQWKIQFARMGEPAFNSNLLNVLEKLPQRYDAPGLMPSVSTIAPANTDSFFSQLLAIKDKFYAHGNFQLQFSLHSTDMEYRNRIIPIKKWSFERIARYGEQFYRTGDRKITLNFVLAKDTPFEPGLLSRYFDPDRFLIKITPLNPTYRSMENRLVTRIEPSVADKDIVESVENAGFEVIISIGEPEENLIGSNCGQYVQTHLRNAEPISSGYSYQVVTPDT